VTRKMRNLRDCSKRDREQGVLQTRFFQGEGGGGGGGEGGGGGGGDPRFGVGFVCSSLIRKLYLMGPSWGRPLSARRRKKQAFLHLGEKRLAYQAGTVHNLSVRGLQIPRGMTAFQESDPDGPGNTRRRGTSHRQTITRQ